jgi:hypothetical protein
MGFMAFFCIFRGHGLVKQCFKDVFYVFWMLKISFLVENTRALFFQPPEWLDYGQL